MESTKLLYLKFKIAQRDDYLDSQLQKRGFKLTKKTGNGLESFRNYYYEMTEAPNALEVSFKIMPGKNTTKTVTISLSPDVHTKHIEDLFLNLNDLSTRLSFDLLDLTARNKIYEGLHKEGKVDAFYIGLDEAGQLEVEQQAYIPLDADSFLGVKKEDIAQDTLRLEGERAPDLDV